VLLQLAQGLGHHAGQEHAGVDQSVEAFADGTAPGRKVQRRADGCHGLHPLCRRVTGFTRPAQQGITPKGYTGGQQWPVRVQLRKARQYPGDLFVVTRVVGAWREVQLARAATEMWHRHQQAVLGCKVGKCHGVLAGGRAFQSVEEHQQWRMGGHGVAREVDVHKVTIRRGPTLALPGRRLFAQVPA
jgi:hypothetical protein